MVSYTRAEAAKRAGVDVDFLDRVIEIGIVTPDDPERCTPGDVRRVIMARTLEEAGVPLDGVAASIRNGSLSVDFLDAPTYERFSALSTETFRQVSDRTWRAPTVTCSHRKPGRRKVISVRGWPPRIA